MSGLFAVVSKEGRASEDSFRAGLNALAGRPNEKIATWICPRGRAALGISQFLYEDSASALNSSNGTVVAIDGEILNTKEIRTRFSIQSTSSAAMVADLYNKFDIQFINFLDGEFSLALWDSRKCLLLVVRDRFGRKNLSYARHLDNVYVATKCEALFEAGLPAVWDHESIQQDLFFFHERTRTLFKGVTRIPSAHYLSVEKGVANVTQYWDDDYIAAENQGSNIADSELIEQYREAFVQAIRTRVQGREHLAFTLSGGLDSSSIIGVAAAELHLENPIAIVHSLNTIESDNDDLEFQWSQKMATFVNARLEVVRSNRKNLIEFFPRLVVDSETIHDDVSWTVLVGISNAARNLGLTRLTTGDYQDALMPGPVLAPDDISNTPMLLEVKREFQFSPIDHVAVYRKYRLGLALQPVFQDLLNEMRGYNPITAHLNGLRLRSEFKSWDQDQRSAYVARRVMDSFFQGTTGVFSAAAIDWIAPFVDSRLYEIIRRSPSSMIVGKQMLREAARPFLAPGMYNRRRSGAGLSLVKRENDPFYGYLLERISQTDVPFINKTNLKTLIDKYHAVDLPPELEAGYLSALAIILSFIVLQDKFKPGN